MVVGGMEYRFPVEELTLGRRLYTQPQPTCASGHLSVYPPSADNRSSHMWSSHHYINEGKKLGISSELLQTAVSQIEPLVEQQPELPSILSLNHLATRAEIPYKVLRSFVTRSNDDAYRKFSIKKRSGGRRFIFVPHPSLMYTQRWIDTHILKKIPSHSSSFAFAKGLSIKDCAMRHCGSTWIIKLDITSFFESISEIQVYRVFKDIGYQSLVAFELARLCTKGVIIPGHEYINTHPEISKYNLRMYRNNWLVRQKNNVILNYNQKILGYLPQGAPTSPSLSNLIMREIDEELSNIAKSHGLKYTRYSDDLTFSTKAKNFNRQMANSVVGKVYKLLSAHGFQPQYQKTKIIPPGSKKLVLGLLVNESQPKLQKAFKDNLRQHLHYLTSYNPTEHAERREFDSVWGMKCHIRGLIDFANIIEPEYASECLKKFKKIEWPV